MWLNPFLVKYLIFYSSLHSKLIDLDNFWINIHHLLQNCNQQIGNCIRFKGYVSIGKEVTRRCGQWRNSYKHHHTVKRPSFWCSSFPALAPCRSSPQWSSPHHCLVPIWAANLPDLSGLHSKRTCTTQNPELSCNKNNGVPLVNSNLFSVCQLIPCKNPVSNTQGCRAGR